MPITTGTKRDSIQHHVFFLGSVTLKKGRKKTKLMKAKKHELKRKNNSLKA